METLFELRRSNEQLLSVQKELKKRNDHLKQFANVVSHDLKSPLANIISLTQLLKMNNEDRLSDDSQQILNYIEESSESLKNYIGAILDYYKTDELLNQQKEDVSLNSLFKEIKDMLIIDDKQLIFPPEGVLENINKASLSQILLNLIDNAFKYNSNEKPLVTIKHEDNLEYHTFFVIDNGIGIEEGKQKNIFDLFQTIGIKDKNGNTGTGVGLSTVESLVKKLGGSISVESKKDIGSTFKFTIKK